MASSSPPILDDDDQNEEITTSSCDDSWTIVHDRRGKVAKIASDKEIGNEDSNESTKIENDSKEKMDANYDNVNEVTPIVKQQLITDCLYTDVVEMIVEYEELVAYSMADTAEEVEELDEAAESDSISLLSDESDVEKLLQVNRVEEIEWDYSSANYDNDRSVVLASRPRSLSISGSSNAVIICSMMALILGLITGQMLEFRNDKDNTVINNDLQEKLKQLSGIEEKLKELSDVRKALDQIQRNMPEGFKIRNGRIHTKLTRNIGDSKIIDTSAFNKTTTYRKPKKDLKMKKIEGKIEKLQDIYSNICVVINKINSNNETGFNDACEVPKIVSDMITFKNNVKRAFNKSHQGSPLRRKFKKVNNVVDTVTESLLFDYVNMFARFSAKVQDSLIRVGPKLQTQLCHFDGAQKGEGVFFQLLNESAIFRNKNCQDIEILKKKRIKINRSYNETDTYEMKRRKIFKEKNQKPFIPMNFAKEYYHIPSMNQWNPKLSLKVEENTSDSENFKVKGERRSNKNCKHCKSELKSDEKNLKDNNGNRFSNKKDENIKKRKKKSDKSLKKMDKKEMIANDFEKFVIVEEGKFSKPSSPTKSNKKRSAEKENSKREKKFKHEQSGGEWQMQRSEGRERLRNLNDWYFVRADSRQTARRFDREPTQFFDENSYRF